MRSREDAAVPGAPHVLDVLRAAGRRAPGHGSHLRAGLGGLAAALRLPALALLPGGGRPALLHLSEHGAFLLRELHRRAGEAPPAAPAAPPCVWGPGGSQAHPPAATHPASVQLCSLAPPWRADPAPGTRAITPSSHRGGSFTFSLRVWPGASLRVLQDY